MSAVHTNATVANVRRIVILSERTASDGAFARQARRKFVSELLAVAEGDATAGVRSQAVCQVLVLCLVDFERLRVVAGVAGATAARGRDR